MQALFTPFAIRGRVLKNRIVMPALASFLVEEDGAITDRTIEHYRRRAAGGPAMVMVEACAVSPEGMVSARQARLHDDRYIEGFAGIARALKAEGALPALQIHHGGRQTPSRVIGRRPLAPSALPCPRIRGEVEPLSRAGIQEIVRKFGQAAARALEAGFELIEIHGAHGYLVNQFLSGFSNNREDDYGGDTGRRTRFALEVVQEVRRRVGRDFPISFKISAQEFVPQGLTVEESLLILERLVPAGVDVVQVSAGNDATPEWICQPAFMPRACLAPAAQVIRQALGVPVMAVGRINDPRLADTLIAEGKADLICMGRGLLADPEMPAKARQGRLDDIRRCIACNTCLEAIFRRGRVECLVNPSLGREREMIIRPARRKRKVMVAGGGPAGLKAAWVAAKRGHDVHLFEMRAALGGQLNLGGVPGHKRELLCLIAYHRRQAEKFGVHCRLNFEATLETIRREDPDVLVLATGSRPLKPSVPGIDRPIVHPLEAVLNGRAPAVKKTVVVGGGATGCEVALHLAENGSPVTLLEQLPEIGKAVEAMTRRVLFRRLETYGVRLMAGCRLAGIADEGVFAFQEEGRKFFVEAERVVLAVGSEPVDHLYAQARPLGLPIYRVGDCLEPRTAKVALYEGALVGRRV